MAVRKLTKTLVSAAESLSQRVAEMQFADPVTHVYNPLDYAGDVHRQYLARAQATCRVLFLGMNPGPWGMAQTGVPFGEIAAVRDFLGLDGDVAQPDPMHPKRPVDGFDCPRSEVSGRRLWGWMQDHYQTADAFFADVFVVNYCPLVFMESSARNRTPDKLPADERQRLTQACDDHLVAVIDALKPKHMVGVGVYAEGCLARVSPRCQRGDEMQIHRILHPSPASPAANKDWSGKATAMLTAAGVW